MKNKSINTAIEKMATSFNGGAGVILAFLVLLLVVNIFGRFIKYPIIGNYEGVQYGFALIVCFAIACTTLEGKHIEIDLLFNRYNPKIKAVLEVINRLVGAVIFILITWRLCADGVESILLSEKSSTLGLPVFLFKFLLAIGFLSIALVLLVKFWNLIGGQKCRQ